MNKAFMVFSGYPQDGCLLVFAENRNKAKSVSVSSPFDWEYQEMNTERQPNYDKYSKHDSPHIMECNDDLPKDAPTFFTDFET